MKTAKAGAGCNQEVTCTQLKFEAKGLDVVLTNHVLFYLLQYWMLHHPHLEELGVRLHPRGGAALPAVLRVGILVGVPVLQVVVENGTVQRGRTPSDGTL